MAKTHVTMKVNGAEVEGLVEPRTLLVHFIRENLLADRHPYRLRDHPLRRLHRRSRRHVGEELHHVRGAGPGSDITTIEGVANADGSLSALQEGFRMMHGLQCGFCTPGMILRAQRLLKENPSPTEAEIRMGISGNFCRCTGYQNIVKAIQYAAAKINGVEFQEAAE